MGLSVKPSGKFKSILKRLENEDKKRKEQEKLPINNMRV